MKISILLALAILIPAKAIIADSFWWTYNGSIPSNAVKLSDNNEFSKYICRVNYEGFYISGEVNRGKCVVHDNNETVEKDEFEILINDVSKFKSYKPNYAVYVPRERDDLSGDDEHLEVFYSFRYRMSDYRLWEDLDYNNYFFLAYSGKFDFYTDILHDTPDSRESSPVINRLNNPEVHYRVYLSPKGSQGGLFSKYFDFAFGHESNGQTLGADSYKDFRDNDKDGVNFVDYISRGWDYLSFEYKFEYDSKSSCNTYTFSCLYGHFYTRRFIPDGPLQGRIDDDIFWQPTGNTEAQIDDFDGLRFIFGKEYPSNPGDPPSKGYWVTYRTGINNTGEFNTFSINLRHDVGILGFKLPVYLKYFHGYGKELSTYHEKDKELTIGLQFR